MLFKLRRISLIVVVFFGLSACAHRLRIETIPSGAAVSLNDLEIGQAPVEVNTVWWPFRQLRLKIELPGYRTQTVNIGKSVKSRHILFEMLGFRFKRLFGKNTRRSHKIILVRKHNQAGTWLPDDAYRMYK